MTLVEPVAAAALQPPESPRQKLAQVARKSDMQAANDGARAAAQTAVLINGGAATAILAFLSNYLTKTSTTPAAILYAAAASLAGYGIGVGFAAWSMWCASQACGQFGLRWEAFLDKDGQAETNFLTAGNQWLKKHISAFGLSIVLFLLSSIIMALGFFLSVK